MLSGDLISVEVEPSFSIAQIKSRIFEVVGQYRPSQQKLIFPPHGDEPLANYETLAHVGVKLDDEDDEENRTLWLVVDHAITRETLEQRLAERMRSHREFDLPIHSEDGSVKKVKVTPTDIIRLIKEKIRHHHMPQTKAMQMRLFCSASGRADPLDNESDLEALGILADSIAPLELRLTTMLSDEMPVRAGPPGPASMRVKLRMFIFNATKEATLDVEPTDTIWQVKLLARPVVRFFQAELIVLKYRDQELMNERTLAECGIAHDDEIVVLDGSRHFVANAIM